jgi:putative phosphoribosyl transferase
MPFDDRADAGQRLAQRLQHLKGEDAVVVGLPRGGVPVAFEVAHALGAPLDVIVVRKLGVPFQPELGMGAIGEDGVRVVNDEVVRLARVSDDELAAVEERERVELERRALRFRGDRPRVPLAGRTVIVVDDGIATGSTARAACLVARAQGAARIVLAVPVAPPGWTESFEGVADELISVETPEPFIAPSASSIRTSRRPPTRRSSAAWSGRPRVARLLRPPPRRTIRPAATRRWRCSPEPRASRGI